MRERSGPTTADLKRLFARSGNVCAFPKCNSALVEQELVLGEVCHIKSVKPGGPRYDQTQTADARHAYDNLILLCANHHKVVDDDEEAYTVERLHRMKSAHEQRSNSMSEEDAEHFVAHIVNQSVQTENQRGGITANSVTANTINIQNGASGNSRSSQAVEKLWNIVVNLKAEFSDALFVDSILTAEELDAYFRGNSQHHIFDTIRPYQFWQTLDVKMKRSGQEDADRERPFVGEKLFQLFFAIRAVCGRLGALYQASFESRSLNNWRTDDLMRQTLERVLPCDVVATARNGNYALYAVLGELERRFLSEAEKLAERDGI